MSDIAQITAALANIGVQHAPLRLFAQQHNLSYTDGERVFCKVSRPGFSTREVELELKLANHYGSTLMLEPRYKKFVMLPEGIMTVWVWEPMISLWSDTATERECTLATDLLTRLHRLPRAADELGLTRLTDFSFLIRKMDQRVGFAAAHGLGRSETEPLYDLYEGLVATVQFKDDSRFVLNHGDPHFGNLVRRGHEQRLCYIDYESAQMSYREFDIAAMRVNLDLLGRNPDGWAAVYDRFSETEIDVAALEIFTMARLLSMTAYGLLHPDAYDTFRERLRMLNTMYATGNIPSYFPRLY